MSILRTVAVAWLTDLHGRRALSIRLPGKRPEGFRVLPNGDALVTQDSGGAFLCQGLRSALFPETLVMMEP